MVERFYRGLLDANLTIDELHNALGQLGYTGSIGDRVSQYGAAQGYTGGVSDIARTIAAGGGGGGGGGPTLTSITMSSATQDDLDITVAADEILEVFFEDVGVNIGGTSFLFHDGTSFRNGATDYRRGWQNSASVVAGDHTTALDLAAGSNYYGQYRFTGFNNANASPMLVGSDPGRLVRTTGNFVSATQVRLGTLANYDGTGTIRWRKHSIPTLAAITALDFSVDASSTIAGSIAVGSAEEIWADHDGVTGGVTRLMWRVSDNSTTFSSASEYSVISAHVANLTAPGSLWNVSLDGGIRDSSPMTLSGLQGGGWPTFGHAGLNTYGITNGHRQNTAAITHIGPHEWDDGTSYNAGVVTGVAIPWATKDSSVVAVAGGSTSIIIDVTDYDNAEIAFAIPTTLSGAGDLQMTFSTDGGSTYESTNYWYLQALGSYTEAAANIYLATWAATASAANIRVWGLGSGMMPVVDRIAGPTTAIRGGSGGWQGGTDAITHIKLDTSGGTTFNATNVSISKWTY